MATTEEIKILEEAIKQQKLQKAGTRNPESVTSVQPVDAAKVKEQKGLESAIIAGMQAAAAPQASALSPADAIVGGTAGSLQGTSPAETRGLAPGSAQAVDDAGRQLAGPLGDVVAGTMKATMAGNPSAAPDYIHKEYIQSLEAEIRLKKRTGSEAGTTALQTAGEVGQIAALPGSVFATPLRAATSGGAIGGVETLFDRLRKGDPVGENGNDYFYNTAVGGAGGMLGYHIGKMGANIVNYFSKKFGMGDGSLTEAAERLLEANTKERGVITSNLQKGNVQVNRQGLNNMYKEVRNAIGGIELNPRTTPNTYQAMVDLGQRVQRGGPITLENLNAWKRTLAESIFNEKGATKGSINERDYTAMLDAANAMEKWVQGLLSKRQFVVNGGSGRLQAGLKGWGMLDELNQRLFRQDRILELIHNAETSASSGKISFEDAIQQEFQSLWKNKPFVKRIFTNPQMNAIRKIAEGDLSKRAFTILDRWMGSTIIAPATRLAQSAFGGAFEAEESRRAASSLISNLAGKVHKARVVETAAQTGAKTGVAGAEEIRNR